MHPSWFQSLKYYTGIISLGVLLGLGLQFAQAWSNPTQSAPNGNVPGPVNLGLLNQVKQGSLGLLGNLSAGLVQLTTVVTEGSPCPSTGLVGRDTNGVILSCQGGVWRKGMGVPAGTVVAGCNGYPATCWGGASGPRNCPTGSVRFSTRESSLNECPNGIDFSGCTPFFCIQQ